MTNSLPYRKFQCRPKFILLAVIRFDGLSPLIGTALWTTLRQNPTWKRQF